MVHLATDDYVSISSTITVTFDIINSEFLILNSPIVTVSIVEDNITEDVENFTLNLTPRFAIGFNLTSLVASPDTAQVIITDNDGK